MTTKDWSATQYLKFASERTRPSRDLIAQIPLKSQSSSRIIDLGCGPGNSTAVLAEHFPSSHITGLDSSPDMISKAKATALSSSPTTVDFTLANLTTYVPPKPIDLFFSNAVFQWLPSAQRIPTIKRLLETQSPGGVFALQVPDNVTEPSHEAMRSVASDGPWAETLGPLSPVRDPFQSPQELYDQLVPLCSSVDIWHTNYQHVLADHAAVVEWVKGTGLRPFIDPLSNEDREEFLRRYLARIKDVYPTSVDGKVLLRYPRLFLVAVRK